MSIEESGLATTELPARRVLKLSAVYRVEDDKGEFFFCVQSISLLPNALSGKYLCINSYAA